MIGNNIAKSADKFSVVKENLHLQVRRGLYHELDLPVPELVVGMEF